MNIVLIPEISYVLLPQIHPDDAFGEQMLLNLEVRR